MELSQKVTPFLWFDNQAEEAINLYCSLIPDSKIITITRYPDSFPGMAGKVLTAVFQLGGLKFMALDGGPQFKFTEAVSLYVNCEDQKEVDMLWNKLIADGGAESQCGWLKDKYGMSWQIIPKALPTLMTDPDREKAGRVMQAMMKMHKIEVDVLQKAYDGK